MRGGLGFEGGAECGLEGGGRDGDVEGCGGGGVLGGDWEAGVEEGVECVEGEEEGAHCISWMRNGKVGDWK